MLASPGTLPTGSTWSFELKWDGFRALVSTEEGLRVRSRRGWNMTPCFSRSSGSSQMGSCSTGSVCKLGLEGVIAKKQSDRYRPGERRWVKMKNPGYLSSST
jgi:ATP-dependent DNA ligase